MDCNSPATPDRKGDYPALGKEWGKCALTHEKDGTPFRWRDPDRIVHATVEWPLDPANPETIGATRCGMYDVPPGESWSGYETLTCANCAAIEASDLATVDQASSAHTGAPPVRG